MAAQVLHRVQRLPFDDDRRKPFLEITTDNFAAHLLTGLPEPGALFKLFLWREHVSVHGPPETSKHAGRPIIIKGVLDSHGHNLLNNKHAAAGGIPRNHNSSLRLVEKGLKEAGILSYPIFLRCRYQRHFQASLPHILDEN
jgi:hypothetical protein